MGAIADIAESVLAPLVVQSANTVSSDIHDILDERQDLTDPEKVGSDLAPTTPLKAETIRSKRRRGSKTPTIPRVDTGAMRDAVRAVNVSRFQAEVGLFGHERERVSLYQHFGTQNIPERPFFGISSRAVAEVEREIKSQEKQANKLFDSLKLPGVSISIKL